MKAGLQIRDRSHEVLVFRRRVQAALVVLLLAQLVVVQQLFSLQVQRHGHYTTLSQENRVRVLPLAPSRGLIHTGDGHLVAENRSTFDLEVVPEQAMPLGDLLRELRSVVLIEPEDVERFERARLQKRRFDSIPLKLDLDEEEVARFSLDRHRFPGVSITARWSRRYPEPELYAHLVGYVGRIDEDDLRRLDPSNYAATTHVGKSGVERSYEDALHGRVGHQQVEVNAQGRVLRVLERTPAEPGRDLYLSIDSELQLAAWQALGERRGAVVAIDPETGRVLAFVSKPGFDPNAFVNGIPARMYSALRESIDRPLFNRALQGTYPPGSTVKPFVALAGLDGGLRQPDDGAWCPGWYSLPGKEHRYRCWKKGGHGRVALEDAIAQSCDVYFYDLARDLGIDRLSAFMQQFGFGRRTGIDLPGEVAALMPSREWKQRVRKLPWFPGETVITGIGQGFVLASPLQLAVATATLARRGEAVQPRVVAQLEDAVRLESSELVPAAREPVVLHDPAHWTAVIEAMHAVVQGARGTARKSGEGAWYAWAGKTGTAQLFGVKQHEDYDDLEVAERLQDHALFIAFAPLAAPTIALAIVVENGGSGSGAAAPIARTLLDLHLGTTPPPVEGDDG